jgi:2-oxoisovalerate dehydrogenase E2 component (dihydrolipoyl transacylase)
MAERVFVLPDLGEGLEEGRVLAWLVKEGDEVALNQPIAEIETAKAVVEIPSPFAGRVATLHAAGGDDVPVGAPLVTYELALEDPATAGDRPHLAPVGRVSATPAVRRLAKDLAVDLDRLTGTGPAGRVTAEDVRAAAADAPDAEGDRDEPISATRRGIADTLTRAVREVPQVTTFRTLDATALQSFREQIGGSPLPIVLKAFAETCRHHATLNASYLATEGVIRIHGRCHVGVAMQSPGGLVVPVVRDVWAKTIGEISAEIRRLSDSALTGRFSPADLTGATVSVSNYGSYGSEAGTPILVPPQATILGIGVIAPRAMVVDDAIAVRASGVLSITFDHRLLDGHVVGTALTELLDRLQSLDRLRDLPR